MDFFERQRTVRTSSVRLVTLFVLAVVMIVVAIDAVVVGILYAQTPSVATSDLVGTALVMAVVVAVVIGVVSLVKLAMLNSKGGAGVARQLGGVPLEQLPNSLEYTRYRNVVEEVAIASSAPVPQLFVLLDEPGINAFAAGSSPADAAVAVTRGTLERLNRDELQAVIGHEFSHIVNGDMRLNIRLIGVLAGITALGVIGRVLLYSGGGRGRGGKDGGGVPLFVIGLAALLVGWIGLFFARLIKAAVSRQREYLADASAVQYTRQTEGLAGALKKIGGLETGSKLRNGKAEDVSHMLFGEGLNFTSMFATHPPLVERIRVLEPTFEPDELAQLEQRWRQAPPNGLQEDAARGLVEPGAGRTDAVPEAVAAAPQARGATSGTPQEIAAGVGAPSQQSYEAGARLIAGIPATLMAAAHREDLVVGLIHGLLMSQVPDVQRAQYDIVAVGHGREVADQARKAAAAVDTLDPAVRLPLAELAFPALRQHSKDEIRTVIAVVSGQIRVDQQVSVFEYCLGTLLWTHMSEVVTGEPPWGKRHRRRLAGVREPAATLLSAVARAGHADDQQAVAAFQVGSAALYPESPPGYAPPAVLSELDAIWGALDGLEGRDKARLVEAIVATAHADRYVTTAERELVRTVCGVVHCPIPADF